VLVVPAVPATGELFLLPPRPPPPGPPFPPGSPVWSEPPPPPPESVSGEFEIFVVAPVPPVLDDPGALVAPPPPAPVLKGPTPPFCP